jgi:Ca-activated chloride channel homolog
VNASGRLAAALALAVSGAAAAGQLPHAGPPSQPPGQQAAPFRSGVDLVALTVTVTDASGRWVTDLAADDFLVAEDGVKQEIGYFSRTNLPLAVSLLLDSSASMEERMATAQTAAIGFVRTLRPEDQAQIIDFDGRVTVLAPFASTPEEREKAIRSTVPGGSTSLYNAVYIALKELARTQPRELGGLRRQAIIVLSDGEDTSSLVSFETVLEQAKRSETVIYAIGIRSKDGYTGKGFSDADFVLRQLTSQTGGRVFFPERVEDLPGIYARISDELSSQYMLGYSPANPRRDGQWRRIAVRTSRPGLTARTRQGYYAPGAPPS